MQIRHPLPINPVLMQKLNSCKSKEEIDEILKTYAKLPKDKIEILWLAMDVVEVPDSEVDFTEEGYNYEVELFLEGSWRTI